MNIEDFIHLKDLRSAAGTIKSLLVYDPSKNPNPIAHHTDLNSLKSLVQKPAFRLCNEDRTSKQRKQENRPPAVFRMLFEDNWKEQAGNILSDDNEAPR